MTKEKLQERIQFIEIEKSKALAFFHVWAGRLEEAKTLLEEVQKIGTEVVEACPTNS